MSDTQMALPGMEIDGKTTENAGTYGQGETERETRAAIAEIEAETPLAGVKRMGKQLAISLAKSIDRGNAKGRAVANEAAQLFLMMQQLAPAEDETTAGDDSHLTPETRRLLDALAAAPQLVPAEDSHPA